MLVERINVKTAKKMRNDHLFPLFEWKGSVGLFFQCDRVVDRF